MSSTSIARSAVLGALVSLAACDRSVFDLPSEPAPSGDAGLSREDRPGGAAARGGAGAGGRGAPSAGAQADAGSPPATDAGSPDAGAESEPDEAGSGGTSGAAAGSGGTSGKPAAGSGGTGGAAGQSSDALRAPSCPTLAPEPGAAFCYDFEQGIKGPNGGNAFWLWETPDSPAASALSTQEQPPGSGEHVLFVSPPLSDTYPSATIGHDILRFSHAVAELDLWANEALLSAEKDVVFFRYLPDESGFEHITELVLRRNEAFLRMEDGSGKEYKLARLPSVTGKTHVRVELDRSDRCQARVYFDDALVATSDAVSCGPDGQKGFVEYGLVMLDRFDQTISALYDNIALGID